MSDLNITLVQTHLEWENHEANIEHFNTLCAPISNSDLLILPETFSTGFSMTPEHISIPAESNIILDWMTQIAHKKNMAICGSFMVNEAGCFYNRFHFVEPNGTCTTYDKRHLFRFAGEHKKFSAGKKKVNILYKGWRIKPFVCYDLRFPVWSRSINDCDLMIYVANWPAVRASVWQTLLQARAMENQCYVAGVNRIGIDGKQFAYQGNSAVINPIGQVIHDMLDKDGYKTFTLSKKLLDDFRAKFPVYLDADNFNLLE